jgi:hypothetical protein
MLFINMSMDLPANIPGSLKKTGGITDKKIGDKIGYLNGTEDGIAHRGQ